MKLQSVSMYLLWDELPFNLLANAGTVWTWHERWCPLCAFASTDNDALISTLRQNQSKVIVVQYFGPGKG